MEITELTHLPGWTAPWKKWDEITAATASSDNYRYEASHTFTEEGLAKDGTFTVKHDAISTAATTASYEHLEIVVPDSIDYPEHLYNRAQHNSTSTSEIHTTENGKYRDVVRDGSLQRQQSGAYNTVVAYKVERPRDENYHHYFELDHNPPEGYSAEPQQWTNWHVYYSSEGKVVRTTEGTYSPDSSESSTSYESDLKSTTERLRESHNYQDVKQRVIDVEVDKVVPIDNGTKLYSEGTRELIVRLDIPDHLGSGPIEWFDHVYGQTHYIYEDPGLHLIWEPGTPTTQNNPAPGSQTVQQGGGNPGVLAAGFNSVNRGSLAVYNGLKCFTDNETFLPCS